MLRHPVSRGFPRSPTLRSVIWIVVVIAAVLVVLIGLWSVGWAVGKTREIPPQIVVDVHEAIDFCAEALPIEVTSVLSYDELRVLLRLHLEWVQAYHYSPDHLPSGPIVYEQFDAVEYVMERADLLRLKVERDHVVEVVAAHDAYLQVMGALHIEDPDLVAKDLGDFGEVGSGLTAALDASGSGSAGDAELVEPPPSEDDPQPSSAERDA